MEATDLTGKPAGLSWEQAGALHVVGATAWAAVRALDLTPTDTLVVSGAAGGVGSLAVQLARRTGATVIGLAGEANHEWLREKGVLPLTYGDGVADRINTAAPKGVDAFLDTFGGGYVELALRDPAPVSCPKSPDWSRPVTLTCPSRRRSHSRMFGLPTHNSSGDTPAARLS